MNFKSKLFCLFICFLLTRFSKSEINSYKNEACLSKMGQFPVPEDCRKFVNCYNGRAYVQICALGTLFNPKTLECDYPAKVECLYSDFTKPYIGNNRLNFNGSPPRKVDQISRRSYGPQPTAQYYQPEPYNPDQAPYEYFSPEDSSRLIFPDTVKQYNHPNGHAAPSHMPHAGFSPSRPVYQSPPSQPYQYPNNPTPQIQHIHGAQIQGQNHIIFDPNKSNSHGSLPLNPRDFENQGASNHHPLPHNQGPHSTHHGLGPSNNQHNHGNPEYHIPPYQLPLDKDVSPHDHGYPQNRQFSPSSYTLNPSDESDAPTPTTGGVSTPNTPPPGSSKPEFGKRQTAGKTKKPIPLKAGNSKLSTNNKTGKDSEPKNQAIPRCPPGFSGLMQHPTDCLKFLSCANGQTYVMNCSPGTRFNPVLSICDHPRNVDCPNKDNADNDNDDNDADDTTQSESNTDETTDVPPEIDVRFGKMPDETSSESPDQIPSQNIPSNPNKPLFKPANVNNGANQIPFNNPQSGQNSHPNATNSSPNRNPFQNPYGGTAIPPSQPGPYQSPFTNPQNVQNPHKPFNSNPVTNQPQPFNPNQPRSLNHDQPSLYNANSRGISTNQPDSFNPDKTRHDPYYPHFNSNAQNSGPRQNEFLPLPPKSNPNAYSNSPDGLDANTQNRDGAHERQSSTPSQPPAQKLPRPKPSQTFDLPYNGPIKTTEREDLDLNSERIDAPGLDFRIRFPTSLPIYSSTTQRPKSGSNTRSIQNSPPDQSTNTATKPNPKSNIARMLPSLKSVSSQVARLRGGPKASEGFLEVKSPGGKWGIVCDEPNSWTIHEAHLVCKQLGYERGAESTWQGRPTNAKTSAMKEITVNSVKCTGNESSIFDCMIQKENKCDPERDGVWVRCRNNRASFCRPGEISYKNKCYALVVPDESKGNSTNEGFSQGEAIKHCSSIGGRLLDILSQDENDFLSEWLVSLNKAQSFMTSGVGVAFMGRSLWIWEGSNDSFIYHNWWPGWEGGRSVAPMTHSGRALCVVLQRFFPCPSTSGQKQAANSISTRVCDAEYYFWATADCGEMTTKHPYICERPADDIGCVKDNGVNYTGTANVTTTGEPCMPWNTPAVFSALKYKISDDSYQKLLHQQNFCRNPGAADSAPWCYVKAPMGVKKEFCDIPDCEGDKEIGKKEEDSNGSYEKCGDDGFECRPGECLTLLWICDGKPGCTITEEEGNCTKVLEKFSFFPSARLYGYDVEIWDEVSPEACALRCLKTTSFECRSFSYETTTARCFLGDGNVGLSGDLHMNKREQDFDYYEMNARSYDCGSLFICQNGKCIDQEKVCDGHVDCNDFSDEKQCPNTETGFQIRLAGGRSSNEGRIEVKVLGEWGVICDDSFNAVAASIVCKEVGFPLGAAELKTNSFFKPADMTSQKPPFYVMDDVRCSGNESSIEKCSFPGWGVHDCGPEEVAGVVCRTESTSCPQGQWQCEKSKECIPITLLCDNEADCKDESDESPVKCKSPVSMRLVGGNEQGKSGVQEGRLEIKRFGVWGTVCDDDFTTAEATVACRALEMYGPATFRKEAAFGPGKGPIWLDEVHCNGNESSLEKCLHGAWGRSNCQHDEDISIICSPGAVPTSAPEGNLRTKDLPPDDINALDSESNTLQLFPQECGQVDKNLETPSGWKYAKVAATNEITRGSYPWQASLRVRAGINSIHWCGAVIISSLHILTAGHCLEDYIKGAYYVRVGDHDSEVSENGEQELNAEEIYLHEKFNDEKHLNNDIALIKLKKPMEFNKYVQPICLPSASLEYEQGFNCSISGWGAVGNPGSGYVRKLKAAWVPILSHPQCSASTVYGPEALSEGMFCAGYLEGGPDSCKGDSGGPMACYVNEQYMLLGITSWGHGCGKANKPGVYSKIAHYRQWIDKKVRFSMRGYKNGAKI